MTDHRPASETPNASPAQRVRYRIRFTKAGVLRWISHRDLVRLWERMARRAGLPLSMSEGFRPKPRIAFPSALALGLVGLDEVVEIQLGEAMAEDELLQRLRADDQPGLDILSVHLVPEEFASARLKRSDYVVEVPASADLAEARLAVERLKRADVVTVVRKEKTIPTHVASEIPLLEVTESELRFSLVARDQASIRPDDVLRLLGFDRWPEQGATITRLRVHLEEEIAGDRPFPATDPPLSIHS